MVAWTRGYLFCIEISKQAMCYFDKDMNARLGDFGLVRMHQHGEMTGTTQVVGTAGYMAPEVVRTGRASAEIDMFGFGIGY
ncbi:hypothetical protein ACFX1R_027040 [Malus domestica]